MESKKIIISGINGFIGCNLKNYLVNKYKTLGVSRKENKPKHIISYSKFSVDDLKGVKTFIHLAGKAHDVKNVSSKDEYFQVNTALTKKLFDLYLQSSCEVFVFLSSVKAIADKVVGTLDENYKANPITAYGKSKLAAEEYILSQKLPKNKRVYILRPCMVHGPNNKGNLNLLYNFVSKGVPYPFGAFNNKRSFVSVENLCFVIKELIENKDIPNGVYHMADDEAISTNQLIQVLGDAIERPSKIWNLNTNLVRFIGKIGDVLPLPIDTERVEKLTENYVVSNKKIKKAIQKELPLTTKQGLIKTFKSFNS